MMLQLEFNLLPKILKLIGKLLNYKFGILLDNKILDPLRDLIIEVLLVRYLSMISREDKLINIYNNGYSK
jgi:hypothetical protein